MSYCNINIDDINIDCNVISKNVIIFICSY
nr:MAG TPA: hypothetical protein [Caudoviricetes sp.]